MALVIVVPLLTLVLIRLLWSGSSLWFLTVGLILLGVAAVIFLARRPQDHEYSANALAQESNRVPLVLAAVGVLFLAMLLLPNFASGDDGGTMPLPEASNQDNNTTTSGGLTSDVAGPRQGSVQTQPTAQPVAQQPSAGDTTVDDTAADDATTSDTAVVDDTSVDDTDTTDVVVPEGSQTYVVEEGDTLWDIATTFGTSVDAIILANGLDNPSDIQIDQELSIPPPDEDAATGDESVPVDDGATQ
jgi:LysM repeat protein